jgi:hypothetical protein
MTTRNSYIISNQVQDLSVKKSAIFMNIWYSYASRKQVLDFRVKTVNFMNIWYSYVSRKQVQDFSVETPSILLIYDTHMLLGNKHRILV